MGAIRNFVALACILVCSATLAASDDPDPTEPVASLVALEKADQPLDMAAPASQFSIPDGEELWKRAKHRALHPPIEGGGVFDASALMGEGFRYAKNFHAEYYSEGETGDELTAVIAADEANKVEKQIHLSNMRIIFFINRSPLPMKTGAKKDKPKGKEKEKKLVKKEGAAEEIKEEKSEKEKKASDPLTGNLPFGGRMVITAPKAVLNAVTNEGRASGTVTIEIFPKPEPGKPEQPIAVLSSEQLNWRTWSEPAIGSMELALYTCAETPDAPDPLVMGRYVLPQVDGTTSTILIQGRGMVYESGTLDRLNPIYDEEGRMAGMSKIARNRAIFHRDIQMVMTGTTIFAPMPFQPGKGETDPKGEKRKPKADEPPPLPSKTVVGCAGPAVLDLAAVPRVKKDAAGGDVPPPDSTALKPIALGRRFEFLNGVSMVKGPVDEQLAPPDAPRSRMACKHLCVVYPAGSLPTSTSFPEYAEAVGGVEMMGTGVSIGTSAQNDGTAPAPASPFEIACQRIYFDGVRDNLFMVGGRAAPVTVKSHMGEATAQQFNFRSRTQTLTMPSSGPKRLIIHPQAMAEAKKPPAATGKAEVFSFGSGDTIIDWTGPLFRELRRLPVPGGQDRVKEILTLKDNVRIEQPQGGLRMLGNTIRVVRNYTTGEVEYLEGTGAVDVTMGELQAVGENVTVDMKYDENGVTVKNIITVTGSRRIDSKATLFMKTNAVRADKFIIDRKADTFRALGGALAIIKAPDDGKGATPKPQEAQDAGALFKGISFQAGGNLLVQCDGEFSQDGASRKVTIKKNVIIRQPGTQMLADEVNIYLDAPAKPSEGEAGTPADALFSGNLKSIECLGAVELTTPEQLVQCDRMIHDVKDEVSVLAMDDPENDVRIYLKEESGSTRFLSVEKSLELDGKSGKFKPGGMLLMLPYRQKEPAPRDKYSSPAKKKKSK